MPKEKRDFKAMQKEIKKIVLITSRFPYVGGEQFLETEVEYYCQNQNIEFKILPILKGKQKRELPNCIEVEDIFANENWAKVKPLYFIKALFSKHLYREFFLYNMFHIKKLKILLSSLMLHQFYMKKLEIFLENSTALEHTVFYTYWNNEATYALQSLKEKYGYRVVSRIHRGDIYKEERTFGYLPLKKQFTDIDTIYTITKSANTYLMETYGFLEEPIEISRLGVNDLGIKSSPSPKNKIHLLSCSFLSEVKRVDKIIEALEILSEKEPQIEFKWSHIGDGYLHEELLTLADEKLGNKKNIKFSFLGNFKNSEVYEFYKTDNVDLFINVSESEGVPVSIMEAMSCHIPIIAPDVGGIKDMLIDGHNGKLLGHECLVSEIAKALAEVTFFKDETIRENAYQLYLEKYSASSNYSSFIESLIK